MPRKPRASLTVDGMNLGSGRAAELFYHGFFEEAIRTAAQELNDDLKRRVERDDLDGERLFNHVFSAQDPVLAFSDLEFMVDRDEHDGFRYLGVGMSRSLRNVLTHHSGSRHSQSQALRWLGFISVMRETLDAAMRVDGPDEARGRMESAGGRSASGEGARNSLSCGG